MPKTIAPNAATAASIRPASWLPLLSPLLAALPLAALSISLLLALRAEVTSHARAELLRATAAIAAVLETGLAADTRALEALAASPAAGSGDLAAFREEAQRLLAQQPAWHTLALVEVDRQVMNLRHPAGAELPPASELPAGRVLQTGRASPAVMPDGQFALRVPVRVEGALRYALVAVVPPFSLGQALASAGLPTGSSALVVDGGRILAHAGTGALAEGAFRPVLASPNQVVELADGWIGVARHLAAANWVVAVAAPVGGGLARAQVLLLGAFMLSAVLGGLAVALQRRGVPARDPGVVSPAGAEASRAEMLTEFAEAFRQPLAWLRSAHEALARLDLTSQARGQVGAAKGAAQAAEAVAADMLDIARLDADALAIEEADVDLPALLEDAVGAFRATASGKGVALSFAADPGLPRWVRGDPARLRRLVAGMLREAVGAAKPGEVTLSARLAPQPGAIEIALAGAEALGTAAGRPGSALLRRLAEALGGSHSVGEAGRRVLRLPFRPGAAPAPPGLGLRILVAEDVPAARLLLAAVLERGGHRVTATEDGARALAAMHRASFDMLVVDLHMPGLDGFGVAAAVRSMPGEAGRLPILALTADPPEEVEARCREAGFDAVMQKPFETRRMLGMVEALRGRPDAVGREASRAAAS